MIPSLAPAALDTHALVLLVVGKVGAKDDALVRSLEGDALRVALTSSLDAVRGVRQQAPHVALLVGDATANGGQAVLRLFSRNALAAVVPTLLLVDSITDEEHTRALRNGVVEVIVASADADETKARVTAAAQAWAARADRATEAGTATLDQLQALLRQELRAGVFSVARTDATGQVSTHRLVLAAGMPLAQLVEDFVQRLKPLVQRTQALAYRFEPMVGSRLRVADPRDAVDGKDESVLRDLRVAVVGDYDSDNVALRDALTAQGAQALAHGGADGLETLVAFAPDVCLLDLRTLDTRSFDVFDAVRRDPRSQWTSWLFIDPSEFRVGQTFDEKRLASRIAPLLEADRAITDRSRIDLAFYVRLDALGPVRLLRAIGRSASKAVLRFESDGMRVSIEVEGDSVIGAEGIGELQAIDAESALQKLLGTTNARIQVDRRPHAALPRYVQRIDELRAIASSATESSALARVQLDRSRLVVEEVHAPVNKNDSRVSAPPVTQSTTQSHGEFGESDDDNETTIARSLPPPRAGEVPFEEDDDQTMARSLPRASDSEVPTSMARSSMQAPASDEVAHQTFTKTEPAPPPPGFMSSIRAPKPHEPFTMTEPAPPPDDMEELEASPTMARVSDRPTATNSEPPTQIKASTIDVLGTPENRPVASIASMPPQQPQPRQKSDAVRPPTATDDIEQPSVRVEPAAALPGTRAKQQSRARWTKIILGSVVVVGLGVGSMALLAEHQRMSHPPHPPDEAPVPTPAPTPEPTPVPEAPPTPEPPPAPEPPPTPVPAPSGATAADADALVAQAEAALVARDNTRAEALYRQALEIDPREPHALSGLAKLLIRRGNAAEAVRYARMAVDARSRRATYRIVLGDALAASGDRAGAEAAWNEALRLEPDNRDAHQRLGQ